MTQKLQEIKSFQEIVYQHFQAQGRDLPWRNTTTPYHILVSEFMLQQTQADRVIPKYQSFLKKFPSVKALAIAPQSAVIKQWQGLGYNRRALHLHKTAQKIINELCGKIPSDTNQLQSLPGIGPYTAAAISTFAFNQPNVVIETNIRTVYLHHSFKDQSKVHDNQILPIIEQTIDHASPAIWYHALMDYGHYLKKSHHNPSRRSRHHAIQSKFTGSNRQLRGQIIRLLSKQPSMSKNQLLKEIDRPPDRIIQVLEQLSTEGFILSRNDNFFLKE